MADKRKFPEGICPVKLGKTFTDKHSKGFHTVRYDFRPASVEDSEKQFLQIGSNNDVTITVPKFNSAGEITDGVVFRGSKKPYTKECLLFVDHDTGEITLEQLSSNIQVKKTRGESLSRLNELLGHHFNSSNQKSDKLVQLEMGKRPLHAGDKVVEEPRHVGGSKDDATLSSDDETPTKFQVQTMSAPLKSKQFSQGSVSPGKPASASSPKIAVDRVRPTHSSKNVLLSDLQLSDDSDSESD